ncbi:endonuclease/exonuclease/phosphatase family protein [Cryobacterium melibiosiphilum]|uniref:Endonuclease/exonuclease/phosphatase family protein n=1 Tax=Cryobacterium melibiosiphilum TaxID=995039 RepID=A0A3A5MMM9_9MICO|nr:endonuclease/exonuclease/phosphatase family protein [Cryobacterium melibiosiphilum]RJT88378.1 endonuclease/exonuclease/phosphatase family protein [Cryobacterium melibiosiphilum]
MFTRILRALTATLLAAGLVVLTWPQAVGLQNTWIVAHAVSFRGAFVVAATAGALLMLALLVIRRSRTVAILLVLTVLFGAVNATILAERGLGNTDALVAGAEASGPSDATTPVTRGTANAVTVLSWNTLGDAPGASVIAELALAEGADVVTLPETTEETGVAIAELMRAAGRPMWVHTVAFDLVSKARSTTVLISPDLGDYTVTSAAGSGPPGNTNVLPTVVATPTAATGPTIVAVHAVAPIRYEMSNWRSDLDWLAEQCSGNGSTPANVIMAGDFNATLDHMAGRAASTAESPAAVLGECIDAASAVGSGAVGTWPTRMPALLGSPIDHVMATPNWQVDDVRVIDSLDGAGSDHRPVVATLSPA